jgi:polyhydroxyalkanoate synthesis regulator phasin
MAKGNGGVVSTPPLSAEKVLRKLEKAYTKRGEELDAALRMIQRLERRVAELEAQKND